MDITERQYLELAEDCKNRLKEKDKLIEWYKYRLNEIDDNWRNCEYRVKQVKYLLEYKSKQKKEKDATFILMLNEAIEYIIEQIDDGRIKCQSIDEDTEEIILTLTTLDSSIESM
jgi:protein-arginine kinase